MKQGKKLTRTQKELLRSHGLKADDWIFIDECRDEKGKPTSFIKIQNKTTLTIRIIDKYKRR